MKILIVEDDAKISRVLTITLSTSGHGVRVAPNGLEGIREVRQWLPDLIVTDITMPLMDGVAFCRSVREISQAPIIAISAKSGITSIVDILDAGANDYMSKPFSVPELLARIRGFERRLLMPRG